MEIRKPARKSYPLLWNASDSEGRDTQTKTLRERKNKRKLSIKENNVVVAHTQDQRTNETKHSVEEFNWEKYKGTLDPRDAKIIELLSETTTKTRSMTTRAAIQSSSIEKEIIDDVNISISPVISCRSQLLHHSNLEEERLETIRQIADQAFSLGEICNVTLQYMHELELSQARLSENETTLYPIEIRANEMADELIMESLEVQRRRMYDVLHVLEAIGLFQKKTSKMVSSQAFSSSQKLAPLPHLQQSVYYWGKAHTEMVLKEHFQEIQSICQSLNTESKECVDAVLMLKSEKQAEAENWPTLSRITIKFLNLAIADGESHPLLLCNIAERIHEFSQQQQDQTSCNDIGRRLYDVVSVLRSCNILNLLPTDKSSKRAVMLNYNIFIDECSQLYIGKEAKLGCSFTEKVVYRRRSKSKKLSPLKHSSYNIFENPTEESQSFNTKTMEQYVMKLRARIPKETGNSNASPTVEPEDQQLKICNKKNKGRQYTVTKSKENLHMKSRTSKRKQNRKKKTSLPKLVRVKTEIMEIKQEMQTNRPLESSKPQVIVTVGDCIKTNREKEQSTSSCSESSELLGAPASFCKNVIDDTWISDFNVKCLYKEEDENQQLQLNIDTFDSSIWDLQAVDILNEDTIDFDIFAQ